MDPKGFDDARSFWDERFAPDDYVFGRQANAFLETQQALFRPGMAVLDVATGEGRNAVWLARMGCRVTGIDISPRGLDKAGRLARENGVEIDFECADLRGWQWPQARFDAVVSIFIQFAAPEERAAVFQGMQQALKPDGVLLLQGYTPRQLEFKTGGPQRADHLYTCDLLRGAFAAMEILHLREHEAVLGEGTKHVGRSALIDLVARKRG